jgi:DNA-binding CsgD family transcriptional regulator/tetratricopeptide (TPR) repeat protein
MQPVATGKGSKVYPPTFGKGLDRLYGRPSTPFRGRERELALSCAALTSLPAVVLISGDAGIGKTRLARETASIAWDRGFVICELHCFPYDGLVAYGPFHDLLRDPRSEPIRHLLHADASEPINGAINFRRRMVFDAVRGLLEDIASEWPILLVVEDLHWCDELSAALLADIALRPLKCPSAILATLRDEASLLLSEWRTLIGRSGRVLEVPLGALSEAESAGLLSALLDGRASVDSGTFQMVLGRAEGYPFFIEELAKSIEAANEWRLPRSIADATRARLEVLEEPARRLLDIAAVVGRAFEAGLVGRLLGLDDGETSKFLRKLVDLSLIVERTADQFMFKHALLRMAVLDRQLERETRAFHQMISDDLLATGSTDVDALARHSFAAEQWDRAYSSAVTAGDRAFSLFAFSSAKQHRTNAIEANARLGRPQSPELHLAVGLSCEMLDQFDEARVAYEASLGLANASGDVLQEWKALVSLGRLWSRRDYARAGSLLSRAARSAEYLAEPLIQAESTNAMGAWLLNTGRDIEAVRMHESVTYLFDASTPASARAHTLDRLGMSNGLAGRLPESMAAYDQAIELWRISNSFRELSASLQGRSVFGLPLFAETVPASGRRSADCLNDAMEAVQLAQRAGIASDEAFARMGLASVHAWRCDFGPALAETAASQKLATDSGHDEWRVGAGFIRTIALLRAFAFAEARDELAGLLAAAERTGSVWWATNVRAYLAVAEVRCHNSMAAERVLAGHGPMIGSAAERRLIWAKIELALLRREGPSALRLVDELLHTVPLDRTPPPLLLLLKGKALSMERRVSAAARALSQARDLVQETGDMVVGLQIEAALSSARSDQGRFDDASAARDHMRVASEVLLSRAAEVDRGAACIAGIGLCLAQPGRVALRKLEAASHAGLTRREREIAALIGNGSTNAEIAAALGLSPRTVESHIHRILEKLSARSRVDIAIWALCNAD